MKIIEGGFFDDYDPLDEYDDNTLNEIIMINEYPELRDLNIKYQHATKDFIKAKKNINNLDLLFNTKKYKIYKKTSETLEKAKLNFEVLYKLLYDKDIIKHKSNNRQEIIQMVKYFSKLEV